jgi:hypothetical protein
MHIYYIKAQWISPSLLFFFHIPYWICHILSFSFIAHRRVAICVYFVCPWTRFLSINPFDLQLKINSESRTPSDFYYVQSYIGFPFGDSQHVMNENGMKRLSRWEGSIKDNTKNKLKIGYLFLTFVSSTGNYLLLCSTQLVMYVFYWGTLMRKL